MKNIGIILRYLSHLLSAKFSKRNSSPFLSSLVENVFADNRTFYAFDKIEKRKKELLNDDRSIEIKDFGAGSRLNPLKKRKISNIAQHASIPKRYGELLFKLVNHFEPSNIMELGASLGISTLYLATPLGQSNVVTIEGCPSIADVARQTFAGFNLRNVRLITGEFSEKLPGTLEAMKSVDFIFIDGDHRKEKLIRYFNTCLEYTHEDTVIVVDDINWSNEMHDAWIEINENPAITVSIDLFRLGILFFNKEEERRQVIIQY